MFKKKEKIYNYNPSGRVDVLRMGTLFRAILYNYDNTTNMKKYFTDMNTYNITDNQLQGLYLDDKMKKHPVVKKNKVAHSLCKVYGYEEYMVASKMMRNMLNDNLFDFEIMNNLNALVESFDKLEKLPIEVAVFKDKKDVIKLEGLNDDVECFTDGEYLLDEKDENGRTIIISKPTFLIRKFTTDSYRFRFPVYLYGYKPNQNKIPDIKEVLHSDQYKK